MYEGVMQKHNLHGAPHRIFNCDETGLNGDTRSGRKVGLTYT